jgi:hypothetical protein
VPATALNHFQQDVERARAIVSHADPLPRDTLERQALRSDLLRSAWMFAVGALDAFFCVAYTDVVAAAITSKSRQPAIVLPEFFHEIRFPIRAILEPYARNVNWRWRMAARKMMERETVLSLRAVQNLFNKFFRPGQRFFRDLLDRWVRHPEATKRVFLYTPASFSGLAAGARRDALDRAQEQMEERFGEIFQRRHDCIHNCDRPRVAPQPLTAAETVRRVIDDVEFLVRRCDEHLDAEFRAFLLGVSCTGATISQAGY